MNGGSWKEVISKNKRKSETAFLGGLRKLFNSNKPEHLVVKKRVKKSLKLKNSKLKVKGGRNRIVKNLRKNVSKRVLRNGKENEKVRKKKFSEKYVLTGIKGFDELFEKGMGIPNGGAILVEGGPGSGKTIFCLATINELCKEGKKCLYMSFEESEKQLVEHMEGFNWKARDFIKKGLLRITRFDAIDVSRSIEALLSAAKKELLIDVEPMFFPDDFKPDFVVIDSLTSIASAFSGEESRFRIYMEQLFRYLEKNNITNFLIREVSSPSHIGTTFKEQGEAVSFLSDGIIVLGD